MSNKFDPSDIILILIFGEKTNKKKTYQAFQQACRPCDDDEDLLHQLSDEVHLLTFWSLRGLLDKKNTCINKWHNVYFILFYFF